MKSEALDTVLQWSSTFLIPGTGFMEDNFSMYWCGGWGGFRMIQSRYIYCALYFYCYYISSISDHQALDFRGWGPLLCYFLLPFKLPSPSCTPVCALLNKKCL